MQFILKVAGDGLIMQIIITANNVTICNTFVVLLLHKNNSQSAYKLQQL